MLWSFGIVSHALSGSTDFTIIIFLECCCPCLRVWACWLFFLLFSIWASQFHSLSWSLSYSPSATLIWALSSLKVTLLIQILIMNGGELGLRYGHLSVFQCVSTPCVCASRKCQCVCVWENTWLVGGDDREQRSAFLHYTLLQCAVTVHIELETLKEIKVIIRIWMFFGYDKHYFCYDKTCRIQKTYASEIGKGL